MAAASTFAGYLGGDVIRPNENARSKSKDEWQLILRFDNQQNLQNWENSPVCLGWIARADALSVEKPRVDRVNGLEAWFALPSRQDASAPPKWKTAIVSAIAIYPMISLLPPVLLPLFGGLPQWLGTLVQIAVMMPVMTWIVMPLVTWIFKSWLYPTNENQT